MLGFRRAPHLSHDKEGLALTYCSSSREYGGRCHVRLTEEYPNTQARRLNTEDPAKGIKEAFYCSAQQQGISREEAIKCLEERRRSLMDDRLYNLLMQSYQDRSSPKQENLFS